MTRRSSIQAKTPRKNRCGSSGFHVPQRAASLELAGGVTRELPVTNRQHAGWAFRGTNRGFSRAGFPRPSTGRGIEGEGWSVSRRWFGNISPATFPPLTPALPRNVLPVWNWQAVRRGNCRLQTGSTLGGRSGAPIASLGGSWNLSLWRGEGEATVAQRSTAFMPLQRHHGRAYGDFDSLSRFVDPSGLKAALRCALP